MFIALNTSGLTLLPIAILAQRSILGAENPTDVFIPLLIATYVSTLTAILYVGIRQKLNLFNKTVIGWLGSITLIIALIMYGFSQLERSQMELVSRVASNAILFAILTIFIGGALYKKVNVYEVFIEGS